MGSNPTTGAEYVFRFSTKTQDPQTYIDDQYKILSEKQASCNGKLMKALDEEMETGFGRKSEKYIACVESVTDEYEDMKEGVPQLVAEHKGFLLMQCIARALTKPEPVKEVEDCRSKEYKVDLKVLHKLPKLPQAGVLCFKARRELDKKEMSELTHNDKALSEVVENAEEQVNQIPQEGNKDETQSW